MDTVMRWRRLRTGNSSGMKKLDGGPIISVGGYGGVDGTEALLDG